LRRAGIVDVATAGRHGRLVLELVKLEDVEIVERQDAVLLRFREPQRSQRLHLLRILGREVVRLGAVDVRVEELPAVFVEMAEIERYGPVLGGRLPAVLPDSARAD